MANGAILAHDVLVLKHDTGTRTVVGVRIGPTDEIDDLVGLDRAGSGIHRIRSDARQIIDLECRDSAVAFDADPSALATMADAVRFSQEIARTQARRVYVAGGLFLAIEYGAVANGGRAEDLEFF